MLDVMLNCALTHPIHPPPYYDCLMIIIRNATISDAELLAAVGAETFHDSFAADNTPEDMAAYLSRSFSPEIQERELADSRSKFIIAEDDGEVAGYGHLKLSRVPQAVDARQPLEIARFYARKAWLGKGIGAHLMAACLPAAGALCCDALWLGVWEKNIRAIRFYRQWGFGVVGEQEFQLGGDLQKDLVMARNL